MTEHDLTPSLSIGVAAVCDGDLDAALASADEAMYANKRRRAVAAGADSAALLRSRPIIR